MDPFSDIFGTDRGLNQDMTKSAATWQELKEIHVLINDIFPVTYSDGDDCGRGPSTTTFCFSMDNTNRHKDEWFELNAQPILDKAIALGLRVKESIEKDVIPQEDNSRIDDGAHYICSISLPRSPLLWLNSKTGQAGAHGFSDKTRASLTDAWNS